MPSSIMGTVLHAIGGVSASTCYLPFQKIRRWSWGSYWLLQALFAWVVFPLVIGYLTVPDLFQVFRQSPSKVLWTAFFLGTVYGFGGLSFGLAIKEIGYSLTYTISIGISAILGTLVPLIMKGTMFQQFSKEGGILLLTGMVLAMVGIAVCGYAGFKKEHDLKVKDENGLVTEFNISKGLILTIVAGLLSAVFGISLSVGEPVAEIARTSGAGIFNGNAPLILSTGGAFVTNLVWFGVVGVRNGTIHELSPASNIKKDMWTNNVLLSVLSGGLWYFQFFFYGLGHNNMGEFKFASWVIHMSMLIFFSFMVGVVMKEWKGVFRPTYITLITGLVILIISIIVITIGSLQAEGMFI